MIGPPTTEAERAYALALREGAWPDEYVHPTDACGCTMVELYDGRWETLHEFGRCRPPVDTGYLRNTLARVPASVGAKLATLTLSLGHRRP